MLGRELLEAEANLLLSDLKPFVDDDEVMCECEERKAKWTLTDEYMKGWHMNLCDDCLLEMREEYKEEGTSSKATLIK